MLVFFIHGVATRDVQYANGLKKALREKFNAAQRPVPHFCAGFWGSAFSDIEKMWHGINQDLQALRRSDPAVDLDDCFHYRQLREGLLSEFAGDMFVYLNSKRGVEIRQTLAQQLSQFLADHPDETDLHLIAHSLGTVILWDVLFSDRFSDDDPAHQIRRMIRHLHQASRSASASNSAQSSSAESGSAPSTPSQRVSQRVINLKSITTMGSPILFFNIMLGVDPQRVKAFAARTTHQHLPWLNLIHPADVIAYPLEASLGIGEGDALQIRDTYLPSNALKKLLPKNWEATLLLEGVDAHVGYWNSGESIAHIFELLTDDFFTSPQAGSQFSLLRTQLICNMVAGSTNPTSSGSGNFTFLKQAIASLEQVPGMTRNRLQGNIDDDPVKQLTFLDGSGTLRQIINVAQVHHVYVFDQSGTCRFAGFVGWLHTQCLRDAIAEIETTWC